MLKKNRVKSIALLLAMSLLFSLLPASAAFADPADGGGDSGAADVGAGSDNVTSGSALSVPPPVPSKEEDAKSDLAEEDADKGAGVFYNLGSQEIEVGYSGQESYKYKLFDENGNYTIALEENAFFPYEVQFRYGDATTVLWFDTPESTREVGGHVFSVSSEPGAKPALSQAGAFVGGEYVPMRPAPKTFTATPPIRPMSLFPLKTIPLTLDLTDRTPQELAAVELTYKTLLGTELPEGALVMRLLTKEKYVVLDEDGPVDLSGYDEEFTLELYVGDYDQLDENKILYKITVKTNPYPSVSMLDFTLYAQDEEGARSQIWGPSSSSSNSYDADWNLFKRLYIDEANDPDGSYYLGIKFGAGYASVADKVAATVYSGHFNEPPATSADEITANVWDPDMTLADAGYKESYGDRRTFTVVFRNKDNGVFLSMQSFSIAVDGKNAPYRYTDEYLNFELYQADVENPIYSGSPTPAIVDSPANGTVSRYTLDLSPEYPVSDNYNLKLGFVADTRSEYSAAIYRGHYDSAAEAAQSGNEVNEVTANIWAEDGQGLAGTYGAAQDFAIVVKWSGKIVAWQNFSVQAVRKVKPAEPDMSAIQFALTYVSGETTGSYTSTTYATKDTVNYPAERDVYAYTMTAYSSSYEYKLKSSFSSSYAGTYADCVVKVYAGLYDTAAAAEAATGADRTDAVWGADAAGIDVDRLDKREFTIVVTWDGELLHLRKVAVSVTPLYESTDLLQFDLYASSDTALETAIKTMTSYSSYSSNEKLYAYNFSLPATYGPDDTFKLKSSFLQSYANLAELDDVTVSVYNGLHDTPQAAAEATAITNDILGEDTGGLEIGWETKEFTLFIKKGDLVLLSRKVRVQVAVAAPTASSFRYDLYAPTPADSLYDNSGSLTNNPEDGLHYGYHLYIPDSYNPGNDNSFKIKLSYASGNSYDGITTRVYKGLYDTADAIPEDAEVTTSIWGDGVAIDHGDENRQKFTAVVSWGNRVLLTQRMVVNVHLYTPSETTLRYYLYPTGDDADSDNINTTTSPSRTYGTDSTVGYILSIPEDRSVDDTYKLNLWWYNTSYYSNFVVKIYEGHYTSASEIPEDVMDITAAIWGDNATGYAKKFDGTNMFTLVVRWGGEVVRFQNFTVKIVANAGRLEPLGIWQEISVPEPGSDERKIWTKATQEYPSVSGSGGIPTYAYELASVYRDDQSPYYTYSYEFKPNDDDYYFAFQYYSGVTGKYDKDRVYLAVVGHDYNSLEAAQIAIAQGKTRDIKNEIILDNDYSTLQKNKGYKANYFQRREGLKFTVFADGHVYQYIIKLTSRSADTTFTLKGASHNDVPVSAYAVAADHDSYVNKGYFSYLTLGNGIDMSELSLDYTINTDDGADLYREGIPVIGNLHDFSAGTPVQYTVKAGNGETTQNYYINYVKRAEKEAKLFVAGPGERELRFDTDSGLYHDVFIANVGDRRLEGLKVTLDAEHLVLDDYWTVRDGGHSALAPFTEELREGAKADQLFNVAKIRLLPDGRGDISGTLTISSENGGERIIRLTGNSTPQISGNTPVPAVKYVPYSFLLTTTGTGQSNANFYLTDGALPPGVRLGLNGEIYGVPTDTGSYTFTVSMWQSGSDYIQSYTLVVLPNTDDNVRDSIDPGYEIIEPIERYLTAIPTDAADRTFQVKGEFYRFIDFWIDGEKQSLEREEYDATSGSTVITIAAQTFSRYGEGTHTIAAEFREGGAGNLNSALHRSAQNYDLHLGEETQGPPSDDGTQNPPIDDGTQGPPSDDGTQNPPTDDGTQGPPDTETQNPPNNGTQNFPSGDGTGSPNLSSGNDNDNDAGNADGNDPASGNAGNTGDDPNAGSSGGGDDADGSAVPDGANAGNPAGRAGGARAAVADDPESGAEILSQTNGQTVVSIDADVEYDGGDVVNAIMSDSEILNAIAEAIATATAAGTDAVIEINVDIPAGANGFVLTLSDAGIAALAESEIAALVISSDLAGLTLDAATLDAVHTAAAGDEADDTRIGYTRIVNAAEVLNDLQAEAAGDDPVSDISVTAGITPISDLRGGEISAELPYTLAAGQTANDVYVYHLAENGATEAMPASYNAVERIVTFATTHLSLYAIGNSAKTDIVPTPDIVADSDDGGGTSVLPILVGIILLLAIIGLCILLFGRKRKKQFGETQ